VKVKTLMSWSTGKDSAWALYQLQLDLAGVFCTVNKKYNRTAMHAVRVELLKRQADSLDLPLTIIEIPYPCSNVEYAAIMSAFIDKLKKQAVEQVAFGDLFLEDIRDYRIKMHTGTGIKPIFPIWNKPTDQLSREMVNRGLKTVITCIDPKQIADEFVGQEFDHKFLDALPESVDPCGENGEFHSFAYGGPMFNKTIDITVGEVVHRDGFVFADVLPR